MDYTLSIALSCFAVYVAYALLSIGRRPAGYPPGPPTLPFLGNLHQISSDKTHVQFQRWASQYGPIFSLIMGTKTLIVLSSDDVVKSLLDKRGSVYSSRPDSYITSIATQGLNLAMMQYNETWRMCHKILYSSLNANKAKEYLPYQDLESRQMLLGLLESPELFAEHIRRFANSLTTQMVFGFRTTDIFDPRLLQLYVEFERWVQLTSNAFLALVDFYPPLRRLPDCLLPLKRTAKELYESEHNLFLSHWQNVLHRISEGGAQPCIAQTVRKAQEKEGFSDDLASHLCGILLEAGSDTQATQLTAFVQAMLLFPDVQRTGQAEIDRVCGSRLPIPADRDVLPYTRACVKEICRWMPSTLMGIPHAATKDDLYMGFKIPKGAIVVMNTWAIHMDPKRHPEPRRFDPTRYLHDARSFRQAALSPNAADRDQFIFGAGRRLCPGLDVAENSLFLAIARLFWAFNIEKSVNAAGAIITPDPDDIVGGLPAHPRPFKAKIVARSLERAEQIRAAWDQAKAMLDDEMQWPITSGDSTGAR